VLVADLGGSSLRAALIDPAGATVAAAAVPDPMGAGEDSEPEAWWSAFGKAVEQLAREAPDAFAAVAAIAVTGATRTMVCLDGAGRVLGPASTFRDARAAAVLPELLSLLPPAHPETREVNAFHPLARLFRMQRSDPAALAGLAHVIEPKDFLNFRLTGRAVADAVSSARLAAAAQPGPDGASLTDRLGWPASLVPEMRAPTGPVGPVRAGLPGALAGLAGRPVLTLSHDTWAAVLGLGALREGVAYNLSGTTEVFGVVSRQPAAAEGLMRVDWGGGLWQLGGPSLAGADTLSWALHMVGRGGEPVGKVLDDLLAGPRGPGGPLVLPHLQGERVPWWNPGLRGAVLGLARAHGPGDLVRATLEGVAFLNRLVLERAEAALGITVPEIRFGGGGAGSAAWAQIKADVTGRPVCVTESPEPGLTGCALAAFVALGLAPGLDEAQERFVAVRRQHAPSPAARQHYEALYRVWLEAEAAVAPLSEALAKLAASD
jgi:xylulokinase